MDDGYNQMKLLDSLKKEFRLTRIYWRHINDNVAGVDEINMCTMRSGSTHCTISHTRS